MLSVLDSDKRLADHFGGKVRLINLLARLKLTSRCISDTTNSVNSYLNSQTNEWPLVKTSPNLKHHHNKEHTAHHQVQTTTAHHPVQTTMAHEAQHPLPPLLDLPLILKWPHHRHLFILKYLLRMKCRLLDMVIKSRGKLGNWSRMLKLKGRRGGIGMKINMRGE
jgi:hypothetical protein